MQNPKKLPFSPILLLVVGIIAVGMSSILIKMSSSPTSVSGMYRLFITVILMVPFIPWKTIRTLRLSSREWIIFILAGIFLGLHFLFWMESLTHTSVASSVVILTLQPVFVMIGSNYLFKERVTVSASLCMLAAVVGSIIIAWGDIGISRAAIYGDLLSLIGTVAVSLYMLAGQQVSNKVPTNLYSFVVFLVGGLVLLVYNVVTHTSLVAYPPSEWIYFLLLAIIPTICGQYIFNLLLKHMGATTVSMGIVGEPVVAILLAYLLLGEHIGVPQLVGGLLTVLGMGMYFQMRSRTRSDSRDKSQVESQNS